MTLFYLIIMRRIFTCAIRDMSMTIQRDKRYNRIIKYHFYSTIYRRAEEYRYEREAFWPIRVRHVDDSLAEIGGGERGHSVHLQRL